MEYKLEEAVALLYEDEYVRFDQKTMSFITWDGRWLIGGPEAPIKREGGLWDTKFISAEHWIELRLIDVGTALETVTKLLILEEEPMYLWSSTIKAIEEVIDKYQEAAL